MVEEQLTRNRRLLEMKGVAIAEEEPEPEVDAELVLKQHKEMRVSQQELDMLEKQALELLIECMRRRLGP
jgi:transposase-like protein